MHRSFFAVVLMAICFASGCSRGSRGEAIGTVDGKVTYQGKAVPSGSWLIVENKEKGVRSTFSIKSGGEYSIGSAAELPVGTYTVAVTPPTSSSEMSDAEYDELMKGGGTGKGAGDGSKDFPVPEKFRSTETSGTTIEVKEGSQTINIDFSE